MWLNLYRQDQLTSAECAKLQHTGISPITVRAEWCFAAELNEITPLPRIPEELKVLRYPIEAPLHKSSLGQGTILRIGPRRTFETPFSSTMRVVYASIGITVSRIERVRCYEFTEQPNSEHYAAAVAALHDPMTQMVYHGHTPLDPRAYDELEPVRLIPLLEQGIDALRRANAELVGGLGMTETTIRWLHTLFTQALQRNPTDSEVATLALANSEHCRHQSMRGPLVIDGVEIGYSLFDLFMRPYLANQNNSIIAFHDDASAIHGWPVKVAQINPETGDYELVELLLHSTNIAETHNGPTEVAPYPGAATGPGGELRDSMCVGRGGIVSAGGFGICVANLLIPGYDLPWENRDSLPRTGLPGSSQVLTEGSTGAFDFGNCFGRPVIAGFAASFEQVLPDGTRHGWRKPLLYSHGIGEIHGEHAAKNQPEPGMLVVQLGGPAYPIGIGGGTFSSKTPGATVSDADLSAVQRPDPALERSVYNVVRRCIELGGNNPIESAHDLGAGGSANALPEIVGESGGRFDVRLLPVGDSGMNVLEIFICEAQERIALLVRPENWPRLKAIAEREGAHAAVVGQVTQTGRVTLYDSEADEASERHMQTPVDLPTSAFDGSGVIEPVLLTSEQRVLTPLRLPHGLTVREALERVFRLKTVGSKHFLVDKVDRSVGGRVAQQQCVGPFHIPLCGYGLTAHSMQECKGTAFAYGERHRFGFISPAAQARMAVVEILQKFMGVLVTDLADIRFNGNWMWPPMRENGNGVRLHEAAKALADISVALGIAEDGGKDSIFMRSFDHKGNMVVSPAQLVLAPQVTVPDVCKRVTPEVKQEGNTLILIDLSGGRARLGGSALAQVYGQVGDDCPDVADFDLLKRAFTATRAMLVKGDIVSLHGIGDGGLVTTLIEMAIAGGLGIDVNLKSKHEALAAFFAEEAGVVVECPNPGLAELILRAHEVPFQRLGAVTGSRDGVSIALNNEIMVDELQHELRWLWSETSSRIDEQQSAPEPIRVERTMLQQPLPWPDWQLTYTPSPTVNGGGHKPLVAVLRAPSTNGEYEMAEAAMAAGFRVRDVTISDLVAGRMHLDEFQGLLLPGGFSYGDIPQAGVALATIINHNEHVAAQFAAFRARPDTFAFGVCNGAQLMLRLGWAPFPELPEAQQPRFVRNRVERHKSSFVTVQILDSTSLLFEGMAGSRLGVWVSHGEGRLDIPDGALYGDLERKRLVPMCYVTPDGQPVTADSYPYNPSGTPRGWPAVCSPNGRFTAIMPHPERLANRLWQWPWLPEGWQDLAASPWLRPFQNAMKWCLEQ